MNFLGLPNPRFGTVDTRYEKAGRLQGYLCTSVCSRRAGPSDRLLIALAASGSMECYTWVELSVITFAFIIGICASSNHL